MKINLVLLTLGFAVSSTQAFAADASVEMLNADPETRQTMVFKPSIVSIEPGETVTWTPTSMGHNVEFIADAIPDGVDAFRSTFNKEVSYTFDQPGIYVYKCTPHYAAGMIGIVKVGDVEADTALADVKLAPLAQKRLTKILAE